ncbi:hypothetical protein EF909_00590 [Streptomyces sp. WAC01280]|nr:hypothetical protein EF909_00590 [Streptomyces sp. WAC01280]
MRQCLRAARRSSDEQSQRGGSRHSPGHRLRHLCRRVVRRRSCAGSRLPELPLPGRRPSRVQPGHARPSPARRGPGAR